MSYQLTETKLWKLNHLQLKNPKVKRLLKQAIKGWSQPGVSITTGFFGATTEYNDVIKPIGVGCCLIGAATLNHKVLKQKEYYLFAEAWAIAGVSKKEYNSIIAIFDSVHYPLETDFEKEIAMIRDVVLSNSEDLLSKKQHECHRYDKYDFLKRQKHFRCDFPNVIPANEQLSDWVNIEDCWTRTIKGGNPEDVKDRRCFIEKTPRVYDRSFGFTPEDWRSWVSGYKGDYGDEDGSSREWCDAFAEYLGYKL